MYCIKTAVGCHPYKKATRRGKKKKIKNNFNEMKYQERSSSFLSHNSGYGGTATATSLAGQFPTSTPHHSGYGGTATSLAGQFPTTTPHHSGYGGTATATSLAGQFPTSTPHHSGYGGTATWSISYHHPPSPRWLWRNSYLSR